MVGGLISKWSNSQGRILLAGIVLLAGVPLASGYGAQPKAAASPTSAPATSPASRPASRPASTRVRKTFNPATDISIQQWHEVVTLLAKEMTAEQKAVYAKGLRTKFGPSTPVFVLRTLEEVSELAATLRLLNDDPNDLLAHWACIRPLNAAHPDPLARAAALAKTRATDKQFPSRLATYLAEAHLAALATATRPAGSGRGTTAAPQPVDNADDSISDASGLSVKQWADITTALVKAMSPELKAAYVKGLRNKFGNATLASMKWPDLANLIKALQAVDDPQSATLLREWLTTGSDGKPRSPQQIITRASGSPYGEKACGTPEGREVTRQVRAALISTISKGAKPTFKDWEALAKIELKGRAQGVLPPVGEGHFVMSLCGDRQGRLWVGTEGEGVWCYDADAEAADQWIQYTRQSTGGKPEPCGATIPDDPNDVNYLGDDYAYALACDQQGRIWVGHLNHGVSVFNGKQWRNYSVLDGPIGERIFDIKVCPTDGDVWMATSAGLARYSIKGDAWAYFTRAEGLPSDQASALAFDKDGNVGVGTQCDGLAFAQAGDGYRTWRKVVSPDNHNASPRRAGSGLPADTINSLLVTSDGTLYVGTTRGLAWSSDAGRTFQHVRGGDWATRPLGVGGQTQPNQDVEHVLSKDFVTAVAEADRGKVWVAHRDAPRQLFDRSLLMAASSPDVGDSYVACMLTNRARALAIGCYGRGLIQADMPPSLVVNTTAAPLPHGALAADAPARHPATAKSSVAGVATGKRPVYLRDDWLTQGDWVGRYGRQYAVLASANWPADHYITHGAIFYRLHAALGPNRDRTDGIRHWMHDKFGLGLRSLYDPALGHRVQAEWDDHGERYSRQLDGPHIVLTLRLPEGVHLVSLYLVNKDGHGGANRFRDYIVEVSNPDAETHPVARARVSYFYGGVYKTFMISGGGTWTLTIKRSGSFNSICSGLFIDRLSGAPTYLDPLPLPWLGKQAYAPPTPTPSNPDKTSLGRGGAEGRVERITDAAPLLMNHCDGVLAYRGAILHASSSADQAFCRWHLRLWNSADRLDFGRVMAIGWHEMVQVNPQLGTAVIANSTRSRPKPTKEQQ